MKFVETLTLFVEESAEIQKMEKELKLKIDLFNDKFTGWLREQGLPDNFTMPQVMSLAVRLSQREEK